MTNGKSPDNVYSKNSIKKDNTVKDNTSVSEEAAAVVESQLKANPTEKEKNVKKIDTILENTPDQKFYNEVEPMLATLVNQPFDSDEWLYEIKWDGYRAVAFMNDKKVVLKSRNNKSFSEKFYPIQQNLEKMKLNAVLDGEIVVLGKSGTADFGSLQNWRSEADGDLVYYVFDILWYNGKDLKELPLTKRKMILENILPPNESVLLSEDFHTSGVEFLEAAKKMGLEGIMAKRKDSSYHVNRTKDWLKIKANKRQEVVIGGFTKNDDTRKQFSSLLVGVYDGKKLVYTGKVGTGFNAKMQKEMMELFKPLITNKVPFSEEPDVNKPSRFRPNPPHATVTWLKPELIGEVSYTELTSDGIMRHPSFEGMRFDKNAKKVVLEKEKDLTEVLKLENSFIKPRGVAKRKTLLNPTETTQVKKISRHELKFTNLNKVFWTDNKVTKRDLINYYYQIAPFILPYLKGRPQSMNRFPNGIAGKSFYFKDITGKAPDWIERYKYRSDTDKKDKQYLVGSDEATLLYMANLACIEMNPWNSTVNKPDHPTYCIIDLDPDQNTFDDVIETALVTKQILDDMGVPCYCKTSGSTGLHIYIPLGNKYTYEQSKEFARIIVKLIHNELPKTTSIERQISDRKGKMYLDFLQNRPHATIASVYSIRPKPGATVSMPLEWDEVKKGLKMTDFTIFNALERLESIGDIFKPILGKGINMVKILSKISEA